MPIVLQFFAFVWLYFCRRAPPQTPNVTQADCKLIIQLDCTPSRTIFAYLHLLSSALVQEAKIRPIQSCRGHFGLPTACHVSADLEPEYVREKGRDRLLLRFIWMPVPCTSSQQQRYQPTSYNQYLQSLSDHRWSKARFKFLFLFSKYHILSYSFSPPTLLVMFELLICFQGISQQPDALPRLSNLQEATPFLETTIYPNSHVLIFQSIREQKQQSKNIQQTICQTFAKRGEPSSVNFMRLHRYLV